MDSLTVQSKQSFWKKHRFHFGAWILVSAVFLSTPVSGQGTDYATGPIFGTVFICPGQAYDYYYPAGSGDFGVASITWSAEPGTIVSGSGESSLDPVRIIMYGSGTITATITESNGHGSIKTEIANITAYNAGEIFFTATPTYDARYVCDGESVSMSVVPLSDFGYPNNFSWERAPIGTNSWTTFDASVPYTIHESTKFRRKYDCTNPVYSKELQAFMYPPQNAGAISASANRICKDSSPGVIINTANPQGQMAALYWESRSPGGGWSYANADGMEYPSRQLSMSKEFRRVLTGCGVTVATDPVLISVDEPTIGGNLAINAESAQATGNASLTVSSNLGSTIGWYVRSRDENGSFGGWSLFSTSGSNTSTYAFQPIITTKIYEFYAAVQNGVCTPQNTTPVSFGAQNVNYVVQAITQVSGIQSVSVADQLPVESQQKQIQYFDGLGRPMQSVSWQSSALKNDLVQPVVYDSYGREDRKFLPVALQSNGWFKNNNQLVDQQANQYVNIAQSFYSGQNGTVAGDGNPVARTIFESAATGRVLKQGSAGTAWQPNSNPADFSDKTQKKSYGANASQEVALFSYDLATGSLSRSAADGGFYAANRLSAVSTFDEHNNETIEYTDNLDRVICKKVQSGTVGGGNKSYASTYYIYDDFGNLVVVLPPEASKIFIGN